MKIISYSDCSELCALEDAWNRLARQGLFFIPSFSELRIQLAASKSKFKLLAAVDNSQIVAIACFIYGNAIKSYQIGGKKLFNLPIRVVNLFGSCVVGEPDEHIIQNFFHVILEERGFDLINLGQIFVESPLYRAASRLRGTVAWRGARKEKLWWLITLPNSFDDYIASLRETTRHHITRDCRRFERACSQFRLITAPQEVDTFLQEAEKISRRTYQWHFLCGIRNDEATRQHLIRLAESGRLRCYLSYLGDRPCAFGWGELVHKRFSFQQTGYDPKHRKLSPGTALMMRMIRDLIETTDCEVFDFMWGGDDGYKSRLGTVSVGCTSLQVAQTSQPYSLFIAALEQLLHLFKNFIGLIVERGPLKTRLRSALRRRGVGTF